MDLEEIVDYLLIESGPDRARSVLREILSAADLLAENPGAGHSRGDLTCEQVLFWPVFSFLIVYRPETRPLEVVRVLSGRRDIAGLLA